jgi:DNA ligase-1
VKQFTALYVALNETNKTTVKVEALARYFAAASDEDAAWALYFLTGRRLRLAVPTKRLRGWAIEQAGLSEWLFGECYDAVGDLSETIALVLPPPERKQDRSLAAWVERIQELQVAESARQRQIVTEAWLSLDETDRFVWNKLLLGGFRVGVSQQLVLRGLAQAYRVEASQLAERLMGQWQPSAEAFRALVSPDPSDTRPHLRPYPFCLAHPLEGDAASLGQLDHWMAEWKWDGIRAQLVRRDRRMALWSRGEENLTERFPELDPLIARIPDGTVLDGELLPWLDDAPLPFTSLQTRINRKALTRSILRRVPVVFLAYDLIESGGIDVRDRPFRWRRDELERLILSCAVPVLRISPRVTAASWQDLASLRRSSRARGAEGLVLKHADSVYAAGRVRGVWWKWKVEPWTVDAVLTAAQRGSGRRASLYTDYTFSVWDNGQLVPLAKAYSGLSDDEIRQVDAWIRRHMREKFGPVRTVDPELVFELAFEGIQRSTRHKSGLAVRFPRILRWRRDKTADQADSLDAVRAMLSAQTHSDPSSTTGSTIREGRLFER